MKPAPAREELRSTAAAVAFTLVVAAGLLVWISTWTYAAFHNDCAGPCHEIVLLRLLTPLGVLVATGLLSLAVGTLVAVLRRSPAAATTLTVLGLSFVVCSLLAGALEPWVTLVMLVLGLVHLWLGQRPRLKGLGA